jgi:magnesium-protoporphyrin IX monomethyl ester (oxidative) cyclase
MKIEKILLIVPPAITIKSARDINPIPPMGLGYLAAVAEGMGLSVKILDCLAAGWNHETPVGKGLVRVGISYSQIETIVSEFAPDLVGISCHFSRQNSVYHQLFRLIKKAAPRCVTVTGGAHATVCPEELLRDDNCDFLILGEAEESFKEFVSALCNGRDFETVDGLGWKLDGNFVINEKKNWIHDLDSIPFPAYHSMELDMYFGLEASHGIRHRRKFAPIITSRGCPARCTFCSALKVWGGKFRFRTVSNVIEEMLLLKNKYGIEEIMFEDDNVTAHPVRAKELFRAMIVAKLGFVWDTPNGAGVWSMDEEMIDLMKRSGCIKLNFPVESGSQRVLREVVRKPLDLVKVTRLVNYCRKVGLDYGMFLVIGMPGETLAEMWESFKFAAKCGCYTPHISVATPYPGTQLFAQCMDEKLFAKPFSFDGMFIRSYMIKTPSWGEISLRFILVMGSIYLRSLSILSRAVMTVEKISTAILYRNLWLLLYWRRFKNVIRYYLWDLLRFANTCKSVSVVPGNVVFVTGVGRGLGLLFVKEFLEIGCFVVGITKDEEEKRLVLKENPDNTKLKIIPIDLSDSDAIGSIGIQLDGFCEKIDVFIHNAAVFGGRIQTLQDLNLFDIRKTIDINSLSALSLIKELNPLLDKGGRKIVMITSELGSHDSIETFDHVSYSLSKTMLNMEARLLSNLLKEYTVFSIYPGWLKTDMGGPTAPMDAQSAAKRMVGLVNCASRLISGQIIDSYGSRMPL